MSQRQIDTDISHLLLSSKNFSLKTQPSKLRNVLFIGRSIFSPMQVNITYGFFSTSLDVNQSDSYYLFNILQTFCQSRCASLAQFSSESELEKIVNEIRSLSLPQSGRRFILDSISSGMLKLYLLKSFKNKKKRYILQFLFNSFSLKKDIIY